MYQNIAMPIDNTPRSKAVIPSGFIFSGSVTMVFLALSE